MDTVLSGRYGVWSQETKMKEHVIGESGDRFPRLVQLR